MTELDNVTFTGRIASMLFFPNTSCFNSWFLDNTLKHLTNSVVEFFSILLRKLKHKNIAAPVLLTDNIPHDALQCFLADDRLSTWRLWVLDNFTLTVKFSLHWVNNGHFNMAFFDVSSCSVLQSDKSAWTLIICCWLSLSLLCRELLEFHNPETLLCPPESQQKAKQATTS